MGIVDLLRDIPLSAVLREKLKDMERELEALRSRNAELEAELKVTNTKFQELERKLLPASGPKLDDLREKLLVLVMQQPRLSAQTLANSLGATPQLVEFHLEELRKEKYVHDSHFMGTGFGHPARTEWSILQAGRAYLVSNGLLK